MRLEVRVKVKVKVKGACDMSVRVSESACGGYDGLE